MYTVKEATMPSTLASSEGYFSCDNCNNQNVHCKQWCVWNIEKQEWIYEESGDDEWWCPDCEDSDIPVTWHDE